MAAESSRTDTFQIGAVHPEFAEDPVTGEVYRFYLFNRHLAGKRPVVIYNGFGSTPNTTMGQLYLREYVRVVDRPIIAPMSAHVRRRTQRRAYADSNARALRRFYGGEIDVAGLSWGGVLAYSVAEALQDQVRHLVTLSSVGTLDNLAEYLYRAYRMARVEGPVIADALKTVVRDADPRDHQHASPTSDPLSKFRRSFIMHRRSLQHLDTTLHPATTWHDVIGVNDLFTDPRDHIDTVLRRHTALPGSARITLIKDHGHMWAHMKPQLAQVLQEILLAYDTPGGQVVDMLRTRADFSGFDRLPFPPPQPAR